MTALALQAPAGMRTIDFDPQITADDVAVMDLLLIEDCIRRFRKNAAAIPQGRMIELISAAERLATIGKESIA